ncbi:MAG: hypothetical protein ACFFCP_07010 [Promethearchaeota archaeon]
MRIDRQRLSVFGISALPLLIGAALASMILTSNLFGEIVISHSQVFSLADLIIQAIISTGLGTFVVLSLFYTIQKKGARARRTIVAFIVSPVLTVSFFILGQSILLVLFQEASIYSSILSLVTLGILLMSFAFIMMDSIPSYLRNFFVAFYGSVFGTFLGVIFLTASMFVLVVSVIAEDYFLTRYSPAATASLIETPGTDPFELTRIQSASGAVGVGDYIAFSLISAHSLLFFPFYVWLMSISLTLVGIFINVTVIAKENQILPGIPMPALLALFPWAIHLLSYSLIGG